ncbi:MAG: TolC family protein [Ignavibacteria bacterium]|jgi:outer membrane protein
MKLLNKLNPGNIITALMFLSITLSAQEYISFSDAVKMALSKNHDIQIAKNTSEITDNRVHIGNADLLPSIDFTAGTNYYDSKTNNGNGNSYQSLTNTSASIKASYTLFDGFGNIYTFNQLKVNSELGKLETRNSIETTLESVSDAYYNLCSAEESYKITQESVELSKERLLRADKKSQYGQALSIDVLSAKVDLNADSVTLMNALETLREAKRALNILLNRNIDEDLTVDKDVQFAENLIKEELIESAVNNNASYLAVIKDIESAELDLKIAQSEYYPTIAFETSYGYEKSNSKFDVGLSNADRTFMAGLSMNFNLYNGNKNSIQKQNAEITLKNNELSQNKALLTLRKDVSNAYEAYLNSLNILEIRVRNLESAQLNFERSKELYNLGQVTSTTFREAQLNLIEAKDEIANAKYSAKLYEINLLRLSGQLLTSDENFNFLF